MLIHSNTSTDSNEGEQFDDKNICLICYDSMENNNNISILKCGHKYHYNCIYQTYKNLKNKKENALIVGVMVDILLYLKEEFQKNIFIKNI